MSLIRGVTTPGTSNGSVPLSLAETSPGEYEGDPWDFGGKHAILQGARPPTTATQSIV